MSFNLSQVIADAEAVVGLLPAAANLLTGVQAIVPAGTPVSTSLSVVQAGLTSAITKAGGVEADLAAIWPHIESILTAVESVVTVFKASATVAAVVA